MRTVTLTASARYGYGGKQYIARITGRDSKFTFAREFVGRKEGKRRESATHTTDEPGLYVTCDLDSKGRKDETYWVVERDQDGDLDKTTCGLEDAMRLARLLDEGETFEQAVAEVWPPKTPEQIIRDRIAAHESKLAESRSRNDPDGTVRMTKDTGDWKAGTEVRRGDLIAWREGEVSRLRAELDALTSLPMTVEEALKDPAAFVGGMAETAAMHDAKSDAVAEVKALMARHGLTVADLA